MSDAAIRPVPSALPPTDAARISPASMLDILTAARLKRISDVDDQVCCPQ